MRFCIALGCTNEPVEASDLCGDCQAKFIQGGFAKDENPYGYTSRQPDAQAFGPGEDYEGREHGITRAVSGAAAPDQTGQGS